MMHYLSGPSVLFFYRRIRFFAFYTLVAVYLIACGGSSNPSGNPSLKPTLSLVTPVGIAALSGTVEIEWSSDFLDSQTVSILLSADSGDTYPIEVATVSDSGNYSWNTALFDDGNNYRLRLVQYDADGSAITSVDSTTDFAIDNSPPVVVLNDPQSDTIFTTTATIEWQTTDENLSTVDIYLSDDSGVTFSLITSSLDDSGTFSWDASALEGNQYRIRVIATDLAGNQSQAVESNADFVVDNSSPVAQLLTPNGGNTLSGETEIVWATSDTTPSMVKIELSVDSGATYPILLADNITDNGRYRWNTIGYNGNTFRVQVTPTDQVGNQGDSITSATDFSIDNSSPNISIETPTTAGTYSTTESIISLAGTAADNVAVSEIRWENSLGGSGVVSGTTSWTIGNIALFEGINILTVSAIDAVGLIASDVIAIELIVPDLTPPSISIVSPTINPTFTSNVNTITLAGTAADNSGITGITWINSAGGSGTAVGTTNWSYNGLVLQVGVNIITVTARDTNNNTSTDVITVTYEEIDNEPPQINIISPTADPNFITNEASVNLAGTATDNRAILDVTWVNSAGGSGTALGATNWSYNGLVLQAGVNVITVTARDINNNISTDVITITYDVVDNEPPQISITAPEAGGTYTTGIDVVAIAGTSSDNVGVAQISYSVNGGANIVITHQNPWYVNDIALAPGINNITVTAYDAANNQASATILIDYLVNQAAETCMSCHNGSNSNDYAGIGLMNPHPFAGADKIPCTVCHGGNGAGAGRDGSHVPPPPALAGDQALIIDPVAYFNRLTLTGVDQYPDYTVDGVTYSALDYLQFINPGDIRVVSQGRSCGRCHGDNHVKWVMNNLMATNAGVFSSALYAAGIENAITEYRGLYQDTAADRAFRPIDDLQFSILNANVGRVGQLLRYPVISQYNGQTVDGFALSQVGQLNNFYDATNLLNDLYGAAELNGTATNRIRASSALAALYHEQVASDCGNCHLGSAGSNNSFGNFRSSGCTACHMQYSLDGRSRSSDPNINVNEPANPDAITTPERPHLRQHAIKSVAKTLPNGQFVTGIYDYVCATCHRGSNNTVMQYWGIRIDENRDVFNNFQYPANPASYTLPETDIRLFDPVANNNTYNGRTVNQLIQFEDYDGDNRDDTPPDIHHEAGLGCIDCHGSRDVHGGAIADSSGNQLFSRQDQVVVIQCESCHGAITEYARTTDCFTYENVEAECAMDASGNPLRHVTRNPTSGTFILRSRMDGRRHYVMQTRDAVVNGNKSNPFNNQLDYNPKASYAMGRVDGNVATGIGPQQANPNLVANGFSHTDSMDCVSCHAAWTNNCIGCHLSGEYDNNPANFYFSNITGERITYRSSETKLSYSTPVPFTLGISSDNFITQMMSSEKVFYQFFDGNNESQVFVFSDRNGNGNNPNTAGRNAYPASGHNVMMPHSIRGKVSTTNEGPRYCVACHLTTESLSNYGNDYRVFMTAMSNNDFASIDFNLMRQHIGQNTGNQLNSPFWVHMVAGLGSGLFLFDDSGCPVNPIDTNDNRGHCVNGAPGPDFNVNNIRFNMDRIVESTAISNASSSHPLKNPGEGTSKRGGALYQDLSGPLGGPLIQKLADPNLGIVLDSWLDANGEPRGNSANFLQ